jgi:hypothetical protein
LSPHEVQQRYEASASLERRASLTTVRIKPLERSHGTFKEGTKGIRAIKNADTSILDGQRIYKKHICPHQGLNGKTLGQAAGLELSLGPNKSESLIKKASKS